MKEQTNRIYVTNYEDNTFTIIGGACDCVLNTVAAGMVGPRAVAVDETTNRYFIGSGPDHRVTAFDGTSDSPICSADMGAPGDVISLQVNPNNHRVFIARIGSGPPDRYSLISGSNCGLLYNNVPLPCTGGAPRQLVYNPVDNRFYGVGFNNQSLVGYNADTGSGEVCVALPGANGGGFGIGMDAAQQMIYATAQTGNAIYRLYRIPLPANPGTISYLQPGLTNLWELGVDPIGCTSFVFVADDADNQVWVAQDGPVASCKTPPAGLSITKLSQIAPPKSCYNVLTSSQTQLFQFCDKRLAGRASDERRRLHAGNLCTDENASQGVIHVNISPGDYHIVESVAPPNHSIDTGKHDCDASSGTCAVTVIDAPNTRPWFPWDVVGIAGPCGGVDGHVTVADILAVVAHYGNYKPATPNAPTPTPGPSC